jgi:hypothetical protein
LGHQVVALDVLLRHLAHAEAALSVLTLKTLSGENLSGAKGMKDMQAKIYREMLAEIKRELDDLRFA